MDDTYREHLLGLRYSLLRDLIEQHRPVVRRTPMTMNPLMRDAQCPACDGNRWRMVLEGTDEVPECEFWKRAKKLGLIQDD
jgi:hypothetical protein